MVSVYRVPHRCCAFINFATKEGAGKAMGALQVSTKCMDCHPGSPVVRYMTRIGWSDNYINYFVTPFWSQHISLKVVQPYMALPMQNLSPATDTCIPRWNFKFPTNFNETCTETIVVPSTIPSSLFYFQPQHPMTRNRPISECTSETRLAKLPAKIVDICIKYRGFRSNSLLNISARCLWRIVRSLQRLK